MRWTSEDRHTLADLARDQEERGIAQARLDSLPEQAALEELLAKKRAEQRKNVLNKAQVRSDQATVQRLRQDVAKLKERERANVAGLSAQTDPERRRDLKHDLRSTRDQCAAGGYLCDPGAASPAANSARGHEPWPSTSLRPADVRAWRGGRRVARADVPGVLHGARPAVDEGARRAGRQW